MKEKKKRFKHEHGSSFSVDYYAYASHMRSWNAGFKVLFSIISLLICIACNNLFVSLAVIFFMGFLTVAVGGLDLHHYITMLLVPIVFLIFGTIAIAIGFSMRPVGQYHVHFLNKPETFHSALQICFIYAMLMPSERPSPAKEAGIY